MKKGLYIVIAALLVFALAGCATLATSAQKPPETGKVSDRATDTEKTAPVAATPVEQTPAAPAAVEPKTEPAAAGSKTAEPARITAKEAKEAAFAHAGVKETEVRDLEAELEKERGTLYYEVSFEAGRYDYEYLIAVDSAKVVHFEKKIDD